MFGVAECCFEESSERPVSALVPCEAALVHALPMKFLV